MMTDICSVLSLIILLAWQYKVNAQVLELPDIMESCVNPYQGSALYGWKWFNAFNSDDRDAALECWGYTEEQARLRDVAYEKRRMQCIRSLLKAQQAIPDTATESDVAETECRILTEASHSQLPEMVLVRNVKDCFRKQVAKLEPNSTKEHDKTRLECIRNSLMTSSAVTSRVTLSPAVNIGGMRDDAEMQRIYNEAYDLYMSAVRKADELYFQTKHCMHYFNLFGEDAEEYEKLRTVCKQEINGVTTDKIWSSTKKHFVEPLAAHEMESGETFKSSQIRRRNSPRQLMPNDVESQIEVCIFKKSIRGQVAREDIETQYHCLKTLLPSATEPERTALLELFWNETEPTNLEEQLVCKALHGRPHWIRNSDGWHLSCERYGRLQKRDAAEQMLNKFAVLDKLNLCILERIRTSEACWTKYAGRREERTNSTQQSPQLESHEEVQATHHFTVV